MRGLVSEEMEKKGNEGCAGGLACQAGGGEHAACTAGPVVGRGAQEQMVVGRLEESETGTAEGESPAEGKGGGIRRHLREQEAAGTHKQQTETT